MQSNEIMTIVSRIRRAMPRNTDVMVLCDELVARLMVQDAKSAERVMAVQKALGFDKRAYQREYMRKRRAKKVP